MRSHAALLVLSLLACSCGDSSGGSSEGSTGADTGPETTPTTGDETTTASTTGEFEGDPAIYQDCLDDFAGSLAKPTLQCACKVSDGEYPTVEACVEATGLKYADELTCFCEAVALVPASADRLACTLAPANDLVACLEPVACDDVAAQDACSDAHFAASKDCPIAYPDEVYIIEEVSCFGVPAFTCTSGQQIADYRQCDGSVDCTDGSDEQGCP